MLMLAVSIKESTSLIRIKNLSCLAFRKWTKPNILTLSMCIADESLEFGGVCQLRLSSAFSWAKMAL
ncbi:MAG: hypothetical protein KGM99_14440 [Burkholderiales bacterium]|nr:hypothetical protein [Burkholderiales bacterium]